MSPYTSQAFITDTASRLKLSATLEINELAQKRLNQGQEIIHLGFGEATFPVQKDVLRTHQQASDCTNYLPVAGLMELRQSVARFQSRRLVSKISPEQVIIAPGSKPLLFALFDVLRGDVMLPRPSWVSYEPQAALAGKKLFWVETDQHNRHTITESSLTLTYEKAIAAGGNPRILLVNSPSNPTGQVFTMDTTNEITQFCIKHDLTLISDEIYSDIAFCGEQEISPCYGGRLESGRIIMTGGLSKTYSAGGWRVGYGIFPQNHFGQQLQTAILAYASECWSATSAPAQEAAVIAFNTSPEMDVYRQQVNILHKRCTLSLYEALRDCGLDVAEPRGAFYVYPSFRPFEKQLKCLGIHTSIQLSEWLIEECGIAALPGSAFGEDDSGLPGGRYRLRMATSYLYFRDDKERYETGYDLLDSISGNAAIELPLLDRAICAIQKAIMKLKMVE